VFRGHFNWSLNCQALLVSWGAEFHPRLVGLTGSVKAIQEVAHEYHIYYMKTEDEGNDYLVDHSIFMYVPGLQCCYSIQLCLDRNHEFVVLSEF
jgi:hypothetical protein